MENPLEAARQADGSIPSLIKQQIVIEHTPLIRYIVSRIASRLPPHVDLEDLFNTGVLGLIDAIEKFDPGRDCKFKTYAEFRVKGAILDQLRSLDWVPRSVRQKGRQLERAYEEVEHRLGRAASEAEVADSLGIRIDELHRLAHKASGVSFIRMDHARQGDGGDGPLLSEIFEDRSARTPLEWVEARQDCETLARSVADLPEREKLVITLYYYEDLSMKEIGNVLGITESRVCQIHAKSIEHLRPRVNGGILHSRAHLRRAATGARPN